MSSNDKPFDLTEVQALITATITAAFGVYVLATQWADVLKAMRRKSNAELKGEV